MHERYTSLLCLLAAELQYCNILMLLCCYRFSGRASLSAVRRSAILRGVDGGKHLHFLRTGSNVSLATRWRAPSE